MRLFHDNPDDDDHGDLSVHLLELQTERERMGERNKDGGRRGGERKEDSEREGEAETRQEGGKDEREREKRVRERERDGGWDGEEDREGEGQREIMPCMLHCFASFCFRTQGTRERFRDGDGDGQQERQRERESNACMNIHISEAANQPTEQSQQICLGSRAGIIYVSLCYYSILFYSFPIDCDFYSVVVNELMMV